MQYQENPLKPESHYSIYGILKTSENIEPPLYNTSRRSRADVLFHELNEYFSEHFLFVEFFHVVSSSEKGGESVCMHPDFAIINAASDADVGSLGVFSWMFLVEKFWHSLKPRRSFFVLG